MFATGKTAPPTVEAVHRNEQWSMAKPTVAQLDLIPGIGVADDVHAGTTIKHRPAAAENPHRPNDRQVHLIAVETYEALAASGEQVGPGALGENVTTRGLDLLSCPLGTVLTIGASAVIRLTGKRHPRLADADPPPALRLLDTGVPSGPVGVFGVVLKGGPVRAGDAVTVEPGDGGPLLPI